MGCCKKEDVVLLLRPSSTQRDAGHDPALLLRPSTSQRKNNRSRNVIISNNKPLFMRNAHRENRHLFSRSPYCRTWGVPLSQFLVCVLFFILWMNVALFHNDSRKDNNYNGSSNNYKRRFEKNNVDYKYAIDIDSDSDPTTMTAATIRHREAPATASVKTLLLSKSNNNNNKTNNRSRSSDRTYDHTDERESSILSSSESSTSPIDFSSS
jgi:hypothetical protein